MTSRFFGRFLTPPIWILLAIDCQSLRIVHARMLYGPATAYTCCTHVGLLSNGCSVTGPFAVKEGKMFMLSIASLLLFVPLFFLFLFLFLSLFFFFFLSFFFFFLLFWRKKKGKKFFFCWCVLGKKLF